MSYVATGHIVCNLKRLLKVLTTALSRPRAKQSSPKSPVNSLQPPSRSRPLRWLTDGAAARRISVPFQALLKRKSKPQNLGETLFNPADCPASRPPTAPLGDEQAATQPVAELYFEPNVPQQPPKVSQGRSRVSSPSPHLFRARHLCRYSFFGLLLIMKVIFISIILLLLFMILSLLFVPHDRAAIVSGRSEILSIQADDTQFSGWQLPFAELRTPNGKSLTLNAPTMVLADTGTLVMFRRLSRGPLQILFQAPLDASECGDEGVRVGIVYAKPDDQEIILCDEHSIIVDFRQRREQQLSFPLVLPMRGKITVGKAITVGGGIQPVLLSAGVSVLVRPKGLLLRRLCETQFLMHACERYEVASSTLATGDEAVWVSQAGIEEAIGFIRIDPSENASGFSFDIAAPAEALKITRLKGETFSIQESLFDRIVRSPLAQSLSTLAALLGAFVGAIAVVWRFNLRLFAAIFFIFSSGEGLKAEQVHVSTPHHGQAILLSRGDRCYAVTLEHVVKFGEGGSNAPWVMVVRPGRIFGEGRFLRAIPAFPESLVILDLEGSVSLNCPPFTGPEPLEALLRAGPQGQLRIIRPDGGVVFLPLQVSAVDFEMFQVRFDGVTPTQGVSGGLVLIAGRSAGLLVDVEAETGLGRVMRFDRALERLAPWFTYGPPATSRSPEPVTRDGLTLRLLSWSAPLLEYESSPRNVGDGGIWRVASEQPVEVIFALPEGATFSRVTIVVAGLPDPPRSVEVRVSPVGIERWTSLGWIVIEPGDIERHLMFAPRRGGLLKVRLLAPQPGKASMALRGVIVR